MIQHKLNPFCFFRLQKGVIVYICDSRGVRDIYEADGNSNVSSEPLVVLVCMYVTYPGVYLIFNILLRISFHIR